MLKTVTDYDRACMEELQWVAGKTFARTAIRNKRAAALAAGVVLLGGGIGVILWTGALWILALCVLGAAAILWSVFYYPFTGWASCKNLGKNRVPCEFFLEKRMILLMQGSRRQEFPYTQCDKLLEAERNIYVFLENGQGLLLNKSNLKGGTVEELRAMLREKTGKTLTWVGRRQAPKEPAVKQN